MARSRATVEQLTGASLQAALPDVARLRIKVFREWPYLYDGTLAYEQGYLADFAREPDAVVVVARDRDRIVGAATASPLAGHTAAFVPLLTAAGYDPGRLFYFGESVLLAEWRGQGLGHAFFDRREAHAALCRAVDGGPYTHAAFCAVVREPGDARAPAGYRPLDAFWLKRGFALAPGVVGRYAWKECGSEAETEHAMQFWVRPL